MSKIVVLKSGSRAQLDPLHSGFAHGFGIFETIKLAGGRLEFWKAHYKRLLHSANVFNLHFEETETTILEAIRELVQSEKLCNVAVKLSLLDVGTDVCCYIYSRHIELPGDNVRLHLSTGSSLNEHSVLAGHKTHNYMESVHLKRLSKKAGFYDVVRLNTAGLLSETTAANLFFVKDNRLYTPAVSTGILPGVIRAEVVEAARKHSIPVEEGHYLVEDLEAANVAFLTNSSIGIVPVSSIDAGDYTRYFDISHQMVETLKVALSDAKKRKSVMLTDEKTS